MSPNESRAVARTRRAILDAAAAAWARDPGVPLGEIAAAAGVGRTTLHRHYPDRAGLVAALAEDAFAATAEALRAARLDEGAPIAALGRLLHELVGLGDRFAFLLNEPSMAGNPGVDAAEAEAMLPVLELVERGQAEGAVRADLPARWIVEAMGMVVYAAWLGVRDGTLARSEAVGHTAALLLGGIRGPASPEAGWPDPRASS